MRTHLDAVALTQWAALALDEMRDRTVVRSTR